MNNKQSIENNNPQVFFSLYHVCEAVDGLNSEQLKLLSRILHSRLDDLKNVYDKIDFLESHLSGMNKQDNPYHSKSELVATDKKTSSMKKKRTSFLKHKRIIEVQIFDTIKSIYKSIETTEVVNQSEIKSLIDGKLQQIGKII